MESDLKSKLVYLLQNAHAGERAAAFAYNGHWRSVSGQEAIDIKKIEMEEWEHRSCLFGMLQELGARPRLMRELGMAMIGITIFTICRLAGWLNIANFGWFCSMYGAGKLEQGNIVEYEIAARYAHEGGYRHFIEPLLHMAEIEWDHELYFRQKALQSKWSKYFQIWETPPPREQIRNGIPDGPARKNQNSMGNI